MINKEGWQFPDNNCTKNFGLEDSDTETFANDSDGNLSKEMCQNSNDANDRKGKPTKIEFHRFTIKTTDIPGYEDLKNEIQECFDYKGDDPKEGRQLRYLKDTINKKEIDCLRISDFNTTGLVGVTNDEDDSPFYLLTKGSGTSIKPEGNGGSKGIGKYACFVASDLRTVFYSTKAYNYECNREEKGYIGISKLRSRSMHNSDRPNLMTLGTGYYAMNADNAPFQEELNLDPDFKRKDKEYGTDVYLIGYSSNNWIANIAYKILESFMAAIIFDKMEAKVGELIINKNTLSNIINSNLFDCKTSNERKYLKAQFSLFSDEDVQKKEFIVDGKSKIRVYVKTYTQSNEQEASKRCEFIRYPYMRIKKHSIRTLLPYSAICIIENSDLCEKLRAIEDPAHTEWQFNRLTKYGSEKRQIVKLHDEMVGYVRDFIQECLRQDSGEQIEFEGASEYLPSEEFDESGNNAMINDAISISPIRKARVIVPKTFKSSEDAEGPEFSKGNPDGNESGIKFPKSKENGLTRPNGSPKIPVGDDNRGNKEGDIPAVVRVPLGGMKYKAIYDGENKCFDIIFISKYTESNCELSIREVGLKEDRYDIKIIDATINGVKCIVEDGMIKNLTIKEGLKYKISCVVNTEDRFASEVILNAIR